MCIRDRHSDGERILKPLGLSDAESNDLVAFLESLSPTEGAVSYTHLRAHETVLDLVCRLLLEKKKTRKELTILHPSI